MHERVLKRICELVLDRRYVVTVHAYDEMAADDLTVWDVESAVLTGQVEERQRDADTDELKYRIRGKSTSGSDMEVVAKIGATGKAVVITVYEL